MARALALGSVQFSAVIAVAEGVNQARSATSIPTRKRRRRNTGCARRNATIRRVKAGGASRDPTEEARPPEPGGRPPERHHPPGEGQQVLVALGPVEPGGGIVLAVGVVVATLAAAELVPAERSAE